MSTIISLNEGVVIGKQNIPLTQEGDAMYHIAYFSKPDSVAEHVELLQDTLDMEENPNPCSKAPEMPPHFATSGCKTFMPAPTMARKLSVP